MSNIRHHCMTEKKKAFSCNRDAFEGMCMLCIMGSLVLVSTILCFLISWDV